ncbi:hypothetical protein P153DRAFT_175297 [Dothidotthia symphoricarpi CBS 119687]|uniref:C2H2-type domain-containing protein n=1 Tax=Dothidotthia symphoricarpi CBS 119687 TaxID=1392245 RepID=A0A6A6ALJ1_9PLEO|nr:uncharacterized protein P153DRAFT_175297 [Dothidotthia symphoricarpi CBS 119687]KAF2132852.1 hypothetical protein P153DRAFT_175297 [Dothidotthia symphoricarpi CBS 119687]
MPSPSISGRSAMTTLDPRFAGRMGFGQPNLSPQDSRMYPSLAPLVPPGQIPQHNYNLFARHFQDEPWTPHRAMNAGRNSQCQPGVSYGSFRDRPGSDMESLPAFSDSGYGASGYGSIGAKPAHSVISNEPEFTNQELPADVTMQIANMEVESARNEVPEMMRKPADQVSNHSHQSAVQGKHIKCDFPTCDKVFKCKSDHKKHMLKHNKPYVCDIPGCKKSSEGFTTTNDLDRHKKSVHQIGLLTDGKSYKCASKNCRNKTKLWPRLDNFKQHVGRMHMDEDHALLIESSVYRVAESTPVMNTLPMTPMDTALAVVGIGSENAFTGSHLDGLNSPSLTADPEVGRCSFGMITDDFTMDVDQQSNQLSRPYSDTIEPRLHNSQGQMNAQNQHEGPQAQQNSLKMRVAAAKDRVLQPAHLSKPSFKPRSRAPQTKAEHQRVASQKVLETISGELQRPSLPSSDPAHLENLFRRMLNKVSDASRHEKDASAPHAQGSVAAQTIATEDDSANVTEIEVLQAFQAMTNLVKRGQKSTSTSSRHSSRGNSSKTKKCEVCEYEARPGDLRKHMKRHKKPYGCTYPECYKRFGAKSDWKRHENSQHFQLEAFRCRQRSSPLGPTCGVHFRGPEQFKKHLETLHNLQSLEQSQEVKACKIGKNCQVQFWCGFCGEIKPLNKKRNDAWDERFDHIAYHFEKDKKSIDEWVCVEFNKKKKDLKEEKDQAGSDEDAGDVDAVGEVDDSLPPSVDVEIAFSHASTLPPQQMFQQSNPRKRSVPTDAMQPQRSAKKVKIREKNRYCCNCKGKFGKMDASCAYCPHHVCERCEFIVELADVNDLTCRG